MKEKRPSSPSLAAITKPQSTRLINGGPPTQLVRRSKLWPKPKTLVKEVTPTYLEEMLDPWPIRLGCFRAAQQQHVRFSIDSSEMPTCSISSQAWEVGDRQTKCETNWAFAEEGFPITVAWPSRWKHHYMDPSMNYHFIALMSYGMHDHYISYEGLSQPCFIFNL